MPRATVEEHPLGLTWIVEEPMRRACHALVEDGRVWVVDPVECEGAPDLAAIGEPAGVLQLLDRHNRDCAAVAARLGVPHLVVPDSVPGSPFEAIAAVRGPKWKETALWWPARSALVVAELLGTNRMYTGGRAPLGMHLFLRPFVPGALRGLRPEHLLVGHGAPLHGPGVGDQIEAAYAGARRGIPAVLVGLPGALRG
ncbi:MAG: hypothetical protein U0R71_13470 [Solirubrobacterales bacterium]